MKKNYQLELEQTIQTIRQEGRIPSLLLHSCCAPCSSYVLEYLSEFFSITVFYYNPNLYPPEEFDLRAREQRRLIERLPARHPISYMEGAFLPQVFYEAVKGREDDAEGGERCRICFRLRLSETARIAKERGFDYFTTTLSISPLKNAQLLNELGGELAGEYGVSYLFSDFKKRGGYARSVELSAAYDMYRQDYCGCVFSMRERTVTQETGIRKGGKTDGAIMGRTFYQTDRSAGL